MALLPNLGIQSFLCSAKEKVEHFISGFAGYGWKIWKWKDGRYKLEIDDIVVRRTMTVFELLISKIRSLMGALAITQAHGKIKTVDSSSDPDNFLITLEDTHSFVADDFVRMHEYTGEQRSYWVKIQEVREDLLVIPKSEFEGEQNTPEVGDEIIQFGNATNKKRQSAIYLHADEDAQPAIDVMFNIDNKSFDDKVKVRLGASIPGVDDEFKGLYAENGMLKFVDERGEVTSQIWPDGTAELGVRSFKVNPDKSGYLGGENGITWHWDDINNRFVCLMGQDVVLRWENLSDEMKEDLEWPEWVQDWTTNATSLYGEYIASPKSFIGKRNEDETYTGIAQGTFSLDGVERTGIICYDKNEMISFIDAATGEASFAKGSISWDRNGNSTFKGKIQSDSGKIAGFRLEGTGMTNRNDDGTFSNDAYIIFRNDEHEAFVGIGGNVLPASSGRRGLARFENHNTGDWLGMEQDNYTILASARNALNNVALQLDGGCISCFAEKVQIIEKSDTINRYATCIICLNSSEITVTLPEMQSYDDGHVVEIKTLNEGQVRILPGYGHQIEFINNSYTSVRRPTYMRTDRTTINTMSNPYVLQSEGDASRFVYVRNINNGTQYGCWVQFKNPRDW